MPQQQQQGTGDVQTRKYTFTRVPAYFNTFAANLHAARIFTNPCQQKLEMNSMILGLYLASSGAGLPKSNRNYEYWVLFRLAR